MDEINELLESLFSEPTEIVILDCPPGLEGAEIEYSDLDLLVSGVVKNGKLISDDADIPEGATIAWGKGTWVIRW